MREYVPVSAVTDLIDRAVADLGVWLTQGQSLDLGEDLAWEAKESLDSITVYRGDVDIEDEELVDGQDYYVDTYDFANHFRAWAEDYETEHEVIYTSDIFDIYMSNMNDVETALWNCFGGLESFETITDAMSAGVSLYVRSVARVGMTNAIETLVAEVENWEP